MKQKKIIENISLGFLEGTLIKNLKKKLEYGWFSNWVAEKIRDEFFLSNEYKIDAVKVLKRLLYQKTQERNNLDLDIAAIAKRARELMYKKEFNSEIARETRKLVKKIEANREITKSFLNKKSKNL